MTAPADVAALVERLKQGPNEWDDDKAMHAAASALSALARERDEAILERDAMWAGAAVADEFKAALALAQRERQGIDAELAQCHREIERLTQEPFRLTQELSAARESTRKAESELAALKGQGCETCQHRVSVFGEPRCRLTRSGGNGTSNVTRTTVPCSVLGYGCRAWAKRGTP
jgi:septal ring factor EnvC (AmiA/AmiB activator)